MSPLAWSFLLSALGIVGLLLAGSKRKVGWLVGVAVQPLWIVFAITTGQYGFILNAVIYAAVYARNYILWRKADAAAIDGWGYNKADRKKYGLPYRPRPGEPSEYVAPPKPPTVGPNGGAGNSGAQAGRWCNDPHGTGPASARRYAPVHFHPTVRRGEGDIYDEIASGPAD